MIELLKKEKRTKNEYRELAKHYRELTKRSVCLSCPGDVQNMINGLKKIYIMSNFEFKHPMAMYRNKKSDTTTISNSNITDEKAIEFLQTNPERIRLFSKYPKNWETLILDGPTDEEIEGAKKEAAKVEKESKPEETVDEGQGDTGSPEAGKVTEDSKDESDDFDLAAALAEAGADDADDDCCDDDTDEECEECKEKKRKELNELTVKELQKAYPDIDKRLNKQNFIDEIVG